MAEKNSQTENPKDKRRYDPELLKKGLHCDLDQYEMLKRCSDKKDMTEWSEWRQKNFNEDIFLEGANFSLRVMKKVNLMQMAKPVSLKDAQFIDADLQESCFMHSNLDGTKFTDASLQGALLSGASLKGASFTLASVNGQTVIWKPKVNRYSKKSKYTDFTGVSLDTLRIDPATKQLLEYNMRRKNWEQWYQEHCVLRWPIQWFWWISDYGISTKRIIYTFFGLAFVFAFLYSLFPNFVKVYGNVGDIHGFWHALYFSVVTMTTLGFGDIAANPDSWAGQTLLMVQVILGYVLLGALVTRFAVLFTAGGPAGKFSDEKEKEDKKK